ncbi:NlpC/P60 family protein [Lactococcus cremoris]|uniref:NlpC/P60 family protein n=1 Tax=Lactococcus lactis subsp. cremoris TaxID=1359 RepID=UPI000E094334|nr:NlpC/P60 family protein [Lactococcus cremoris]RDG21616.1 hypothetical protein DQM05_11570 [Lactococcus cremoris]
MNKKYQVNLLHPLVVFLFFMSFLFLFVSSSVHADLTNYPTEQEVKQYQKDNYQRIKEEILNQGYSEEQFKAMMNMPYLQPEEDVSQFYKDSQNSSRVKRSTNLQEAVVNEAKKYLGRPYGLDEPRELTCDRLVLYAYKATNIDVPRLTTNQEKLGVEVSLNNLQKGDLIFWRDNGVTYHVAIYVGDNQYIHAPDYGQNVQINSINPYFKPSFARRILPTDNGKEPNNNGQKTGEQYIHRLYNMNEGQHHYTGALFEEQSLKKVGWSYEGVGWVAPTTGSNVYRVYNPNSGEHLYTSSAFEKDSIVKAGWKYEGVSWHSGGKLPVYRLFNPKATGKQESHHYTLNTYERDNLVRSGWKSDGVAWNALRYAQN